MPEALVVPEPEAVSGPVSLTAALDALDSALAGFDADLVSGETAAMLTERLTRAEKRCGAARLRAAARAEACGAHRARGFYSGEEWLARTTGISTTEARAQLDTAAALDACPDTTAALDAGELSLRQARETTRTEAAVPGTETELVEFAKAHSLRGLVDKARRTRLAAMNPDELHHRQHAEQTARHFTNELGQICASFALPPEVAMPIITNWDTHTDRAWRAGRAAGRSEPRDYYAAVVLAELLNPNPTPEQTKRRQSRGRAEVIFVCDLRAYRRGHAHPGEPVHIIGAGPVPVSVIQHAVANDAFVKAVTHDGTNIHTVIHYSRHIPARLRTALELGAAPEFLGTACSEPGCDRRYRLQWDHLNPVVNNGPTSRENLDGKCTPHHIEKTRRDRQTGLLDNRRDKPPPPAGPDAQ